MCAAAQNGGREGLSEPKWFDPGAPLVPAVFPESAIAARNRWRSTRNRSDSPRREWTHYNSEGFLCNLMLLASQKGG
jgi:hypothetical protein